MVADEHLEVAEERNSGRAKIENIWKRGMMNIPRPAALSAN